MNLKFLNLPTIPASIREFFPRTLVLSVLAAVCFILVGVVVSFADDGTVVPTTEASVVAAILSTVMPIIVLLISTLGPAAGTYIIAQIIGFLGITNQNKKLEVEGKLRDVLHFCMVNALKFAYTKAGLPLGSALSPAVISDALFYVKDKNPGTVAALGLNDTDLEHILLTKFSEVADGAPWQQALKDAPPVPVAATEAPAAA